ncbi:MAG: hypothetical protein J7L34_04160 [Thermotogaceae bacterium]|nr:hypothetical protein [Thermotogaceae bacterium]
MKLTMYSELFNIDGKIYLFNILNGALIYINDGAMERLKKFMQTNNIEWLSKEEQTLLMRNGFLVGNFMDESQIAKLYYENSKVATSKTLKIDYALTSKCNLNCPYCFEKGRLNKSYFPLTFFAMWIKDC